MNWQPNVKPKEQVDINDPSFPWKNGKPDWDYYHIIKRAEREERMKGKKAHPAKEHCCALDEKGLPCTAKALGKIELTINGEKKLAPLCQKHKNLYAN